MIEYRDEWPETPRLLWRERHTAIAFRPAYIMRSCVTCGGAYTPGTFRDHLRSLAHRAGRGWWITRAPRRQGRTSPRRNGRAARAAL